MQVAEVGKLIGAAWSALSDAEKAKYNDRSAKAKADYVAKHGPVVRATKEKKGGKEKKVKDPNAPKKYTGFMIFTKESRPKVLSEHPEFASKVTEVAKLVGKMWKSLSEAEKAKYNAKATAANK